LQYCEYHPHYEKAKEWITKNLSDDMRDMYLGGKQTVWCRNQANVGVTVQLTVTLSHAKRFFENPSS